MALYGPEQEALSRIMNSRQVPNPVYNPVIRRAQPNQSMGMMGLTGPQQEALSRLQFQNNPIRNIQPVQPIQQPAPMPQPQPQQTGGLFPGMGLAQMPVGGLMDFNQLAFQMAGDPGPPMPDRAAMMRQIFPMGLPSGGRPQDVGSGRDRDKERALFMLSPTTGIANWTNQALGLGGLFD